MITAKLLQNGGLTVEGGNSGNGEIAAFWGTLFIEGGNSGNGEIAAKWGTYSRRWK